MLGDAAMRIEHQLVQRQGGLFSRTGRRRCHRTDRACQSANYSPAPLRAPPARPDPVRHAPLPLPALTAIPPASPPRASPRIVQLYSQGESRRKSPDRERGLGRERTILPTRLGDAGLRRLLIKRLRVADHVFDIDAGQSRAEFALAAAHGRRHYSLYEFRAAVQLVAILDRAGGTQNVIGRP